MVRGYKDLFRCQCLGGLTPTQTFFNTYFINIILTILRSPAWVKLAR
jgi:hypothetical protein